MEMDDHKRRRNMILYVLIAFAVYLVLSNVLFPSFQNGGMQVEDVTYSQLLDDLKDKKVKEISYTTDDAQAMYTRKGEKDKAYRTTTMPTDVDLTNRIEEAGAELKVTIPKQDSGMWTYLMVTVFAPMLIFFLLGWWLNRRMKKAMGDDNPSMDFSGGGFGGLGGGNLGKSGARIVASKDVGVTFKDVAGQEEAKESLKEVVDFLENPQRYEEIGAKLPRGALLVGPPGTGKTLLAKAVAGEAGVPFFSISGSDFVEMFVGVGASRVRDLFKEAKSQAPSIIFIDEIDAVGRQRGAGLGGGHDEREQTLNQLLVEMDGFEESESVILIAATNRPDILDPALLRPGRFDCQVTVDRPDVKGREQILRVHAENKPMDEDVKFEKLAQMTVGFTGADLANLLNESALLAARRHRSVISMDEVEESMERVIAGPQRKGRVMTEAERTTIAYHESGHALVGHILEHSDPVHKISIVSRGQALGYTLQLPQEDHFLKTKNEMLDELAVFLGGRVAEELMCDDITSGASNDLERATKMAREMVTRLGMSEELGTQVFGEAQHQVFLGRDYADHQDYSEETARRIDIEVQRIMREAHRRAVEILDARRDQLDLMAKVLLEREAVEGDAVNALLDNEWDAYLEREGEILAAKEERNAKAAGMPTKKRAPRMSEEELAADAAAFAQAAMQEDAEAASDDAGDGNAANADGNTDADK